MSGMKMVNQDREYKFLLKKHGFDPEWLDTYPEDVFDHISTEMRGFTKDLAAQRKMGYMRGKLGMIIDGTGHKFSAVKKQRKELLDYGYDTYMVFVTTSLEVAQERNESRPRRLPEDTVEKYWKEVQNNLAFFQGLFGASNFLIVDNNKHLDPDTAKKKFNMLINKGLNGFLNKPLKSKIAKKWVKQQNLVPKKDLKQMLGK